MKVKLITVGKLKEKYLKQGINEYLKRLTPYGKFNIIELQDEKAPEKLSDKEMGIVKDAEGEKILNHIKRDEYVISLAIEGKQKSSERLAMDLNNLLTYGKSKITFIIGGSLGLSEKVYKRSDELLSFSKMTFPHQVMRLILLEQIYRAIKINNNEPYHK
ncbi:23S rRNA (pseudouridine(1915)-N(3))-methyltransferase RlmH [Haloplasma contractile]|uniref:Ribosomal RNA large subunit methyltransferase H n=1 Tax=Haloplasma contractile SSD-17B TaxID=1033810 RepID=F7PWV2_9MOLU|nr:23S rRNA (pseudouridine(1915)-N(3))-methyltransferase RlmH [Haloplasma contractile]ERJ12522.1 Ribosomal RNA large subunit methyltransferase H protein [Haloplasma contractile SSD-17B]